MTDQSTEFEAPSIFNLVFPDGPPKDRPPCIGKHSVGHFTVWQKAIAKAERLDPWLADVLVWHLWWSDLDASRSRMFVEMWQESQAELAAERARADKAEAELARVREVTDLLIDAAQQQLDYMDLCNDKGDLERNLRRAVALARAVKSAAPATGLEDSEAP